MPTHRKLAPKILTLLFAILFLAGCSAGPKKARILERADRYFKAGEYDKAKVEYLNVLRLDNQNVAAFQQLGFIWFEQGVPLRAVPFLLRARELAPQNPSVRVKLGLAFQAVGQPSEARKEAISILQQDPTNSEGIVLLADASQSKEDIADADQQLQKFPEKNTAAFHIASASLAVRKGEIGAGVDEVQQAIALDPKSARAHLVLGYIYLLRKDATRSRSELKAAADLAAPRSEEHLKYAEFQAANGAPEEAKKLLEDTVHQVPDYVPAWRDLAQVALLEKKYDEALATLENIFGRDPDNPDARMLQAQIWLAKGDPGKAITILDKVAIAYPDNPLVKYTLGQAYVASNNTTQGTAAFEQAIAARPDYPEAILALGELNLHAGKGEAAARAMEDLLKKHPDLAQARLLLANAYQALGRTDEAMAIFREETKSGPQSAEAYFKLGLALREQKKNDEARQALEKAAELAPGNFIPINQLVEMDLADKHYDAATQRVEKELTKHPDAATSHFLEAKIYIAHADQRDWVRAEAALHKAIELDLNFIPAYELLVSVYIAENKLSEAIDALKADLAKNPNDIRPLLLTAIIYEHMKDYPRAREAYEKVLAANPNSPLALNNLAYLYAERLNQLDKGYELAQKARTLQPGDGMVADTLGWILYKRGDYQRALGLIQESVTKFPDNAEVQFHLGMAMYMMGQVDPARLALEKATRSTTEFDGKKEAQERLAQLQSSKGVSSGDQMGTGAKSQPNDLIALLGTAEAAEKQGDFVKAARDYEHAFKINPKLASTALKLAQLNSGPLNEPGRALDYARKARDLSPNDPQAAATIGHIALQAGNFSWAYSLLQESARRGVNEPAVLHDLAMASYALGKVSDARKTMQRAIDAKPVPTDLEDAKRFLAMTGAEPPSQAEVETVLKTQPDYVPALMAQATIDLQQNKGGKAASIYQNVLQKYPDFAPAQKQLAAIYVGDSDKLKQAYDLAIKARKALPDDPDLARTLAQLSFKRNEFPYAVQLFQESARKQPLAASDLYYLGMAQLQSRQDKDGRETLERALAAGLPDPLAQQAKQRLSQQQPK